MVDRSAVKAVIAVLCVAALFSACSFATWLDRDRLIASADSGSTAAHVLILAANFWARYWWFLTIVGISSVFTIRRLLSRIL